jgi:hypothetical protein
LFFEEDLMYLEAKLRGVDIYLADNDGFQELYLDNQGNFNPILTYGSSPAFIKDYNSTATKSLVYTPSSPTAPVPGPLPRFGAAAAFGWSRQLRRRLKTAD